jgi:hypothetical protein
MDSVVYHHGRICTEGTYWQSVPCVRGLGQRRKPQLKFCVTGSFGDTQTYLCGFIFSWTLRMSDFKSEQSGTLLKEQFPSELAYSLRDTKGLSKASVPQDRKGPNILSFLFYSTTMETKIRIRFWLQGLEREEINLVLNSVCRTLNHSIVTDCSVTGDVSPQFLRTELPLTNQLTPRTRVLKKFPTLYGIRKFIITFT